MFRKICVIAIVVVAAINTACGATTTSGGGAVGHKALTIGIIENQGSFFFQKIADTLSQLAAKDGGKVIAVNTNNDVAVEAQSIENFVQRKVDVILLSTQSPTGSLAAVKSAAASGIPVICYNSCLSDADSQTYTKAYIKSDDMSLGQATAKYASTYIQQKLGGTAKIAILQCDKFAVCKLRHDGFNSGLQGVSVQVVADQEGFLTDSAATVAQNILTAHPDLDAFWAENDGGTAGAHAAIAGKTGTHKVVVFGTDITPEIANYLLNPDGIQLCSTGQDDVGIAHAAYAAAQKAAAKETITPFQQLSPGKLFTRDKPAEVQAWLATIKTS